MKTKTSMHFMRKTFAIIAAISGMLMPMTVNAADDSTTISESSTAACSVSAVMETSFSVTIPKHITMNVDSRAGTGTGNYSVGVSGQIESGHCITVEPDSSFIMSHNNENLTATVTQDITSFNSDTLTLDTPLMTTGHVEVSGLKGGQYDGIFNFHIVELDHQHSYGDDAHCIVCGKLDPDHQHNYGDNAHCILCDKLNPDHVHSYGADSRCVCGMIDPDHTHNYVKTICTICGKTDPDHVHEYQSNGMCECGAENPDVTFVTFSKSMFTTVVSGEPTRIVICDKSAEEQGYTLAAGNCKDVSFSGDGSVVGWCSGSTLYIAPAHMGSVLRAPADCSSLCNFSGKHIIKSFDGLSNIDWSHVTDMNHMFEYCSSITSLDLSSFNTSNVTNMSEMFAACHELTSLDLSSFDTSNVTDMYGMFWNCRLLTSLDLSSFNTSNVTNMSYMFSGCEKLTSLELSSFDTNNVTNMSSMFFSCEKLTSLNLSSFNTGNVTNMSYMFSNCSTLASLDLSNFNTSNVTDMYSMFSKCSTFANLDLSSFDTSNVTKMGSMFFSCSKLTSVKVTTGKWTLSASNISLGNGILQYD